MRLTTSTPLLVARSSQYGNNQHILCGSCRDSCVSPCLVVGLDTKIISAMASAITPGSRLLVTPEGQMNDVRST
jgi:hypothetical protein